jgi:hypothetical protein
MTSHTKDVLGSVGFLCGVIVLFLALDTSTASSLHMQSIMLGFGFVVSLSIAAFIGRRSSLPIVLKWICLVVGSLVIGWMAVYFNHGVWSTLISASIIGYWIGNP